MNKDLIAIFEYLEREKGINREIVMKAIEESLTAAAQKSVSGASNVTVSINPKTGNIDVLSEKEIVEEVEVPAQEISIEDARIIDPDCQIGQYIDIIVTPKDFGRIAAQKARQVITKKLRGAERDVIHEEYRHRTNELVSGTVKRIVKGSNLIIDLGKVEAVMPKREYPKLEHYNIGDRVYALLMGVSDTENGGAEVLLSRSHPEFVRQLIIQEVPEISDGTVVIEKLVREAGYRTKLAVRSTDSKVDPVGACVGMRGMRVKNVVRELPNEKIDIIPYSEDAVELLQNALSPIEIRKFNISEEDKVISIVIDDDDFPAVIGKKGLNAKLNSQLVGYDLEVQRMRDYKLQMTIQRVELAESNDESLNVPLENIEGVSSLIFRELVERNYNTPKAILTATPEELAQIPGINLALADFILEQIRKQRT